MAKTILLFSNGLDSLLTGIFLKKLNIEVIALRLITPFFGWKYKEKPEEFYEKVRSLEFEEGILMDVTEEFLEVLKKPEYGYGNYANPCVDCKILMLKKAKELMKKLKADFISTGEVVGQRPMSQSKNAIELIEKKAGVKGLVLRPLCAKFLPPTQAELNGLVNREALLAIRGRKRNIQLELAKKWGLKEIPTPSGGCLLNDPQIGTRVLKILKEKRPLNYKTAQFLTLGRHFFEDDWWIVLGRNQEENKKIEKIADKDFLLYTLNVPAPTAVVVQGDPTQDFLKNLLLKYSKKARQKLKQGEEIKCIKL